MMNTDEQTTLDAYFKSVEGRKLKLKAEQADLFLEITQHQQQFQTYQQHMQQTMEPLQQRLNAISQELSSMSVQEPVLVQDLAPDQSQAATG